MSNLWRSALSDLRAEFIRSQTDLRHVLVEFTSQSSVEAAQSSSAVNQVWRYGSSFEGSDSPFEVESTNGGPPFFSHEFYGDKTGLESLRRLSRSVVEILRHPGAPGLPQNVHEKLHHRKAINPRWSRNSHHLDWFKIIHYLGWEYRHLPPLCARRATWRFFKHGLFCNKPLEISWDDCELNPDELNAELAKHGLNKLTFPPDYFFSELPKDTNIFQYSSWTIDLIEMLVDGGPLVTKVSAAKKLRGKGGRPRDTNRRRDREIGDAWRTDRYGSYLELATAFKVSVREIGLALDRDRKRQKKS